jgi:hypothetical protein
MKTYLVTVAVENEKEESGVCFQLYWTQADSEEEALGQIAKKLTEQKLWVSGMKALEQTNIPGFVPSEQLGHEQALLANALNVQAKLKEKNDKLRAALKPLAEAYPHYQSAVATEVPVSLHINHLERAYELLREDEPL